MKIGKLLNAVGNIGQIAEGIKNKVFKKDDVEQVAAERWKQCLGCRSLDRVGSNCAMPGSQPCCADCGCSLGLKLRALSSSCPKGKWKKVMNMDQENELKRTLYPTEEQKAVEEKLEIQKKEQEEKKEKKEECSSCEERKKRLKETIEKNKKKHE